jgi:NDP-sugar pyrophosphorylase family protein
MHGLILAGGTGSRLAADGILVPKAAVPVGGVPQLLRLIERLLDLDCETIVCALRSGVELPPLPFSSNRPSTVEIRRCETPSPVHTLALGLAALPPGPVCCTMVDTVMPDDDWRAVRRVAETELRAGADMVVAATPYVDDERALYVRLGPDRSVEAFPDDPTPPVLVTGGVYALSDRARALVPELVRTGVDRMRGYLRLALTRGLLVRVAIVPRIVDLDRARDLDAANQLVARAPEPIR